MPRIASIATCLFLASSMASIQAADAPNAADAQGATTPAVQDVLAAQAAGLVDVKFIPNDLSLIHI